MDSCTDSARLSLGNYFNTVRMDVRRGILPPNNFQYLDIHRGFTNYCSGIRKTEAFKACMLTKLFWAATSTILKFYPTPGLLSRSAEPIRALKKILKITTRRSAYRYGEVGRISGKNLIGLPGCTGSRWMCVWHSSKRRRASINTSLRILFQLN